MGDYDLTTPPGRTHLYDDDAFVAAFDAPQFWFGYGLSYTAFRYFNLTLALVNRSGLHSRTCANRVRLAATVIITNVGITTAREVAQLYLSRPQPGPGGVSMAALTLAGYQLTAVLAPGAAVTLHFELTAYDLSTVMVDGRRVVTAGPYTKLVGGANPRDTRAPAAPVQASITIGTACPL